MSSHAVVGRSCRCCCLSVPTESGRNLVRLWRIARPTTKSNSLRLVPSRLRREAGPAPPSPVCFLRPYNRMEKKFTNSSSLYKYIAKPFLACSLKVIGEGAERGEGEPIHYFTKRGVFGIDGQLRKPLPSPTLTILV